MPEDPAVTVDEPPESTQQQPHPRRWRRILAIAAGLLLLTAVASAGWIKYNLYAGPFRPTELSEKEERVLDAKIERLERSAESGRQPSSPRRAETMRDGRLAPEPYKEEAANRELRITERELNAWIAKDPETARRVAIALSTDLVSVKLVIPLEDDFPVLGGKTLRLNCGMTLRHEAGRPVVALRGISIGGVPLPSAWLGGLKNVDLIREFGGQGGFWNAFSEGVEDMRVANGAFYLKLRE